MSASTPEHPPDHGHLDFLLATSQIGIWELDVTTGSAQRNAQHDKIFGHDKMLDEWSSDIFLSYVAADDRERVAQLLGKAVAGGHDWAFETSIYRADGEKRWISARGMPRFDATGAMTSLIGHVIDVTDTKRQEERLKLLTGELKHRVTNTMAVLRSMIRMTSRRVQTVEEFAETLGGRLDALTRANRLLMVEDAERASVGAIIDAGLEAFGEWQAHVSATGDTGVVLDAQASQALTLILHELLTNAIKHGALSNAEGRVNITLRSDIGARAVEIDWIERGGPPAMAEPEQGFGMKMLENALQGHGQVVTEFTGSGLHCRITVDQEVEENAGEGISALDGARVLLVEDDPIIALDLEMTLQDCGASVVGPYATLTAAMPDLDPLPDVALLDVTLRDGTTEELARHLNELGVPFVVLSGAAAASLPAAYEGAPLVEKPYRDRDLAHTLCSVLKSG